MEWKVVGGGALRFHGKKAMTDILDLIHDDDDYTWFKPAQGLCSCDWIDVYPKTLEAQNLLLEVVGE